MANRNTQASSQEAWQAYLAGDNRAFECLYLAFADHLYRYGCHLTLDTALVEDAIQDVFCQLYLRRPALAEVANIRSYLFVVLRNHISKRLSTSRKRELHLQQYQSLQPAAEEMPTLSEGEGQRIKPQVRRAMEALPARQKEVLRLRYFEGFDYQEIAEVMGVSYQVARNYASRGMKGLRAQLFSSTSERQAALQLAG